MFGHSILSDSSEFYENALKTDDLRLQIQREEVRLARAFLESTDPNLRSEQASKWLKGKEYPHLDDLVADLLHNDGGVPLELRALGPRPIDNRTVREKVGDFLRDVVGNAARLRAGVAPPGNSSISVGVATDEVYEGVKRGMRLVGARGLGYHHSAYVLTGIVMELAGLTTRRVSPDDDIDAARVEAVRRARRRKTSFDDGPDVIIISTFEDEWDTPCTSKTTRVPVRRRRH